MVLKLMVRVLQHAAVLAAAPAYLHRMYGVEKTGASSPTSTCAG